MASQGRIPPPHLRRPLPGPGVMHPDPYGSATRPPPGGFPHFEMLPPPVVMEQKLSAQHIEIEKLAKENQRLANTHWTLRHHFATVNNELQLLHNHIADVKDEKEHKKRGIIDKISMMEAELEAARSIRMELQQARAEAQSFVASRQELISTYLGIQIFRFYFKCTKCSAEMTFKTDPQNSDYIVESGASRNFEPWRAEDEETEEEKKRRNAEEMGDAMKSLENRTLDSKREMNILAALDEMKSMKSSSVRVSVVKKSAVDSNRDKQNEATEKQNVESTAVTSIGLQSLCSQYGSDEEE